MSYEKIFEELLSASKITRKTQAYDWETVEKKIKDLKVVTVSMVQELAGCKYFQEARQWIERHTINRDGGENSDGFLYRFKKGNNVYYAHKDVVDAFREPEK